MNSFHSEHGSKQIQPTQTSVKNKEKKKSA